MRKSHHEKDEVCLTRPAYRKPRQPKAVKVYTISQESTYLLIRGISSIHGSYEGLVEKLKSFGNLTEHKLLPDYPKTPAETFTDVALVKYERLVSARIAKKQMDDLNYMGECLHCCYAPEFESLDECRDKLETRRRAVLKKLQENDTTTTTDDTNTDITTDITTSNNYTDNTASINHITAAAAACVENATNVDVGSCGIGNESDYHHLQLLYHSQLADQIFSNFSVPLYLTQNQLQHHQHQQQYQQHHHQHQQQHQKQQHQLEYQQNPTVQQPQQQQYNFIPHQQQLQLHKHSNKTRQQQQQHPNMSTTTKLTPATTSTTTTFSKHQPATTTNMLPRQIMRQTHSNLSNKTPTQQQRYMNNVNNKVLREQALELRDEEQGPMLMDDDEMRRKMFKRSLTGDQSLDGTVASIREIINKL